MLCDRGYLWSQLGRKSRQLPSEKRQDAMPQEQVRGLFIVARRREKKQEPCERTLWPGARARPLRPGRAHEQAAHRVRQWHWGERLHCCVSARHTPPLISP